MDATTFLKKGLRKVTAEEFASADKHVSKETIQTRVFERVARLLGKTDSLIVDPDILYVHPEVSAFLSLHVPPDHPAFDENDRLLARHIYSRDHHDSHALYAFCRLLDTKIAVLGSSERNRLHRAFAVDGFRGLSLIEYVSHLRLPLSRFVTSDEKDLRERAIERHVCGVRKLYRMFDTMSVETLATAIRNAIDQVESANPTLRQMTNVYLSCVVDHFGDIKTFIDNLKESIQETHSVSNEY